MLRAELIRPVPELVRTQAQQRPDKVAFVDRRRAVTFAALEARTARLARSLIDVGVGRGDPVVMHLEDGVETVETYLAVSRAGGVGVCVSPNAAESEMAYMARDSGARVMVTDGERLDRALRLAADLGDLVVICVSPDSAADGILDYEELAAGGAGAVGSGAGGGRAIDDMGLDEVAWIVYTSGTTGRPKGVQLTARGCGWVTAACWAPILGLNADDFVLCPLPLFHSYALSLCVLGVLATGATERIVRFSPAEVLERLATEPVTLVPGVPTMFHYLLNVLDGDRLDAPALRVCLSAGAILPAAVNQAFEQAAGVPLLDGYGITETSTMVIMNWPSGLRKPGSCGLPLPGLTVRLVDPTTGIDVEGEEAGEVWVSGPNVMVGYHGRPDATAEVLQHGYYRTGDLARRDVDGYLTICGRTKELIIRGGENIYPAEVEAVLLDVAGVADAAVIGVPHHELGEQPVAFVVAKGDHVDPDAVIAACASQLSSFKVPTAIYEIDAIPRTGSGKVMRHRLRENPALAPYGPAVAT